MAHQSNQPKGAASNPPMIPATSIQKAVVAMVLSFVTTYSTSKITAVANNPSGNTINIWCTGCPNNLVRLSIEHRLPDKRIFTRPQLLLIALSLFGPPV
jgi:hypothetical protein